jgi:hypothetical protein
MPRKVLQGTPGGEAPAVARAVLRSQEEPGLLNWPRLCQQSLNTTLLFAARDHARVGTYQANGAGEPFMACPKRFGERCGQILTSAANPS